MRRCTGYPRSFSHGAGGFPHGQKWLVPARRGVITVTAESRTDEDGLVFPGLCVSVEALGFGNRSEGFVDWSESFAKRPGGC